MGVSWSEFWGYTPRTIKAITQGYQQRKEQDMLQADYMNWLTGQYVISALSVAIDGLVGKGRQKYVEKPFLESAKEQSSLTEEERINIAMQKELLAMEQWISNDSKRGLQVTKVE